MFTLILQLILNVLLCEKAFYHIIKSGDVMELRKIEIMENNELKQYDVLFTIKDEKQGKEFVIY